MPLQLTVSLYLAIAPGSNSQNNEYNSITESSQFVVTIEFIFQSLLLQDCEFFEEKVYILFIFISPESRAVHDL